MSLNWADDPTASAGDPEDRSEDAPFREDPPAEAPATQDASSRAESSRDDDPQERAEPIPDAPGEASSDASSDDETSDEPSLPDVAEALADCVREALERGEEAEVPGLGTFRIERQSSQMETREDGGRLSLSPPRETVVFDPDGA